MEYQQLNNIHTTLVYQFDIVYVSHLYAVRNATLYKSKFICIVFSYYSHCPKSYMLLTVFSPKRHKCSLHSMYT